jgi:DNA-binding NtrC family response regulator
MALPHYFAHSLPKTDPAKPVCGAYVLAITTDLGFYSSVANAANAFGWRTEWARSIKRGFERCASGTIPIIIYDRDLPNADWRRVVGHLSAVASDARILVAAREIDEDLWQTVLRRRGYDVLAKSAGSEHMQRELRFAWLSLHEPTFSEQNAPAGIAVLS